MRNYLTVVLVMLFFVGVSFGQSQKEPCALDVVGETGLNSSYNGSDVGETFHRPRVVQGWVELGYCGNKKVSAGLNLWGSLSTKENPSGGTEGDVIGFVNVKVTDKTNVRIEGGTFFIEGGRIHKLSASVSREVNFSEKVNGSISNTATYYKTSKGLGLPGGIVNKASLAISRDAFRKKVNFTVTPAISVDNNPFGLGKGPVAMIGFVSARITIPLNERFSFFVGGGISNPLAGDTDRGFRKSGGLGISFRIK